MLVKLPDQIQLLFIVNKMGFAFTLKVELLACVDGVSLSFQFTRKIVNFLLCFCLLVSVPQILRLATTATTSFKPVSHPLKSRAADSFDTLLEKLVLFNFFENFPLGFMVLLPNDLGELSD